MTNLQYPVLVEICNKSDQQQGKRILFLFIWIDLNFQYPRLGRRYMAEILPIRNKTLSNQSFNQQRTVPNFDALTTSTGMID